MDKVTKQRLKDFCDKNELSVSEYIAESLNYFNRYGVHPKYFESPTFEIREVKKMVIELLNKRK